jgi:Ca-activated chloride channel homolog
VETNLLGNVDELKYQQNNGPKKVFNEEMMTVKFRYKKPDEDLSKLIVHTVRNKYVKWESTSNQFRFAAAVAQMGMLLSHSAFKGESNYQDVVKMAKSAMGNDPGGYRAEFLTLAEKASRLSGGISGMR